MLLDNLFSGKMENIPPVLMQENITFMQGSVTDLSLLKKVFLGADGIFHEASITSVPRSVAKPADTHEVNLTGTFNILAAARGLG
jgi:UDP-glucose 4-epimerase